MQLKIGDAAFISIRAEYDVEKGQFEFDLNGTKTFFTYDAEAKKFNLYQVDGGYDVDFTKLAKIEMPESYFGTWISDDGQTKVIASKGHLSVAINGGELVEATEASYDEFGVYFTIDGVEYSLSSSYGEDNQIFFANSDYSFRCMLTLQA